MDIRTALGLLRLLLALLVIESEGFSSAPSSGRNTAAFPVPKNVKLLILPGFGNDSGDYVLPQAPQGSLVKSLRNRGWSADQIVVLPVQRSDWLQVFLNGLVDIKFWLGNMPAIQPSFRWYLSKVADEIDRIVEENRNSKVVLVCHSAGGWLGRAALGYGSAHWDESIYVDLDDVLGMVTLGAPHLPPPPEVMDMTRGALRITNECFPGAYHAKEDDLFYITVVGAALAGVKQERDSPFEKSTPTGIAFNSYEAVCGDGTSMGDGLVPRTSAHLDSALQLNLDGVFHSIGTPDKWYGSDVVLDRWHDSMLSAIQKTNARRKPSIVQQVQRTLSNRG